jgi:hypothetical protein
MSIPIHLLLPQDQHRRGILGMTRANLLGMKHVKLQVERVTPLGMRRARLQVQRATLPGMIRTEVQIQCVKL